MQVDPQKILVLADKEIEEGKTTNSFMHFFKYHPPLNGNETQCVPHTDSGLVTLIPIANSQGLEVKIFFDFILFLFFIYFFFLLFIFLKRF